MAGAKKAKPKASDERTKAKPKAARAEPKAKPKAAAQKDDAKAGSAAKPKKPARPKAAAARPTSKSHSSPDTYTDPELRDKLKEEITAGDKGGKPGQWSARKAQLLAHEYEKAGGGYKNGSKKKTEGQKHLDEWTDEDWKTSDGKPADREGGTTRYLPAEAWDKLTPAEKKATDVKKQAGSRKGKQFVGNTDEAREARKEASEGSKDDGDAKPKARSKPKAKSAGQAEAKEKPRAKPKAAVKAESKAKPKARKKSS